MDTENTESFSLEELPASRRLIDELWSQKLISLQAKERALDLIYPARNWGLWVSRIFLVLGIALLLSAIIYFYAYNWNKITPMMKLYSIQLALVAAVAAAYFYGLQQIVGKLLLLSAVILIGVFLAVFGQVYQTGANAYVLFFMWALLALPWVIISEFAALWIVWLVISNIAFLLYSEHSIFLFDTSETMIFTILMLFNGFFLMLKECGAKKGMVWLEKPWIRIILLLAILGYAFIPVSMYIQHPRDADVAVIIGTILSAILYPLFYMIYRYRIPSIGAITLTLLGASIIAMEILWRILDVFSKGSVLETLFYFIMGLGTLGIFTSAIVLLRNIDRKMKRSI